jgi:methylmalonyl-CoA/ethylmalonyl-CoA epimerase
MTTMNRIRHIALSAADPDKTAEFYKNAFGFEEVGRVSKEKGKFAYGVFLTDGVLNLAILKFKTQQGGIPPEQLGVHHFGIQVDSVEEQMKKLEELGAECFLKRPEGASAVFFETKFVGPDGVVFDISDHPWIGTAAND